MEPTWSRVAVLRARRRGRALPEQGVVGVRLCAAGVVAAVQVGHHHAVVIPHLAVAADRVKHQGAQGVGASCLVDLRNIAIKKTEDCWSQCRKEFSE